MHEIESQSGDRTEARLSEALQRMAAASRQGARPEVGAGLVTAFRRHHARRRRIRLAGTLAAVAACLAIISALMSLRPTARTSGVQQAGTPAPGGSPKIPNAVASVPQAAQVRPAVKHIRPRNTANRVPARRQFVALPGYDPAVPANELHVVRVQLPASALWKMGAPVSPDSGARRVLADFVVSQDGTPYAMRLVQ